MVRHVGDPVAFVVADTAAAARDAAELIMVDYDVLPSITDLAKAMDKGAPLVWPNVPHNLVFDWEIGDKAATEAQFAKAAHVTRLTVVNNRIVVSSMEARAAIAEYDAGDRALDAVCQHAGRLAGEEPDRADVQRRAGEVPRHHPRCRRRLRHEAVPVRRARADLLRGAEAGPAGEMGGRPQRGVPRRHARPRQHHAGRAGDRRGRKIPCAAHPQRRQHGRVSVHLRAVYPDLRRHRRCCPASMGSRRSTRNVLGVFTNTVPVDAYRGAGRPESELSGRAPGRCRGARTEHRPRGTAPPQHGAARGDAARDAGRQDLRQRRFPRWCSMPR